MRIFLASDIHASPRGAQLIRDGIQDLGPDLFVAAGDVTNFGPITYARELLSRVKIPTLAVPGNCDPIELLQVLEEIGIGLHGRKRTIAGRTFVGIGGSNPTPFGTPFELSEDKILATLEDLMEPDAILISHAPPKGVLDVVHSGEHVGSISIRRIVEDFQPPLVLCGHIHEARGVATLGPTTIVNPGAAKDGHAALIDLNGGARVRLL